MFPARYAPILFAIIMSGTMSFLVSGFATFRALGVVPNFWSLWVSAWLPSWLVACPILLLLSPFVRGIVSRLVRSD